MESSKLTWREFLLHSGILLVLLVLAYPGVFLRGELISSADAMFVLRPWDLYAPEGFTFPRNKLMLDPLMAFRPDYRLVQQELRNGEWPLWNPLDYRGSRCWPTVRAPSSTYPGCSSRSWMWTRR